MLAVGEDGNLELLTRGPAPRHPLPVYGQAPYLSDNPSTSGKACSGLNTYVGPYFLTIMTSQGFPIGTPIFQRSTRTTRPSSGMSLDQDSIEDYPKIGGSAYWNPVVEDRCINIMTSYS
jgi:hypothetical protein